MESGRFKEGWAVKLGIDWPIPTVKLLAILGGYDRRWEKQPGASRSDRRVR